MNSNHRNQQERTPAPDRAWNEISKEELKALYRSRYDDHNDRRPMYNQFPESGTNYDMRGMHSGKGPRSYKRSDGRIKEIVCERLTNDPYVDASEIEVHVKDSEVILKGAVQNKFSKRRAEDLVHDIYGVAHVENHLRLSPAGD